MQRLHVSLGVEDLDASVRFYTTLFGAAPSVLKDEYARWMLDDPRVNFSLNATCGKAGVDHLGIQVESDDDLATLSERLKRAGHEVVDRKQVTCCYAEQNKAWVADPQGVRWETFFTYGESSEYGENL
ncbi:MAG: ArsI/CadI family heavy metal resistance metalloenzyme [Kiloniellaceae bacterium]